MPIDPITQGAGIQTGGRLLGDLFGFFGGRGQRKRARGEFEDFFEQFQGDRARLLGLQDENLFDPLLATNFARNQSSRRADELASTFNTQGLDISQPLFKGALAEGSQQSFRDILLRMLIENAQAKFTRRGRTAETLLGSSERQLGATRDLAFG